ncbi:hypothetical protein V8F20_010334 [Naviculisporaceae sp. PSN 640]
MSSPTKVIVFGPTGGVGLPTALSAAESGAKVYLGMRDPTKPLIPLGSKDPIPASEEASLGFERVKADFTDPSSVESAIRTTGAKHAFVYLVAMSPDVLASTKESIKAMKNAGVEFVVFLSTASIIVDDIRSIPPTELIPHAHAKVEIALEETFGEGNFAAMRPAYFASNIFWWKNMVANGEIIATGTEVKFDWIVPDDTGRLSGLILAQGKAAFNGTTKKSPVFLHGPKMISLKEAIRSLSQVLGKEIKVTDVELEEAIRGMVDINGLPEYLARTVVTMVHEQSKKPNSEGSSLYLGAYYEEGKKNFELYTGRKPTELVDWLEKIKGVFA